MVALPWYSVKTMQVQSNCAGIAPENNKRSNSVTSGHYSEQPASRAGVKRIQYYSIQSARPRVCERLRTCKYEKIFEIPNRSIINWR